MMSINRLYYYFRWLCLCTETITQTSSWISWWVRETSLLHPLPPPPPVQASCSSWSICSCCFRITPTPCPVLFSLGRGWSHVNTERILQWYYNILYRMSLSLSTGGTLSSLISKLMKGSLRFSETQLIRLMQHLAMVGLSYCLHYTLSLSLLGCYVYTLNGFGSSWYQTR